MRNLLHLRTASALAATAAWIAVAFLVLLVEIFLAVLTVPALEAPIQRFRQRRQHALDWGCDWMHAAGG